MNNKNSVSNEKKNESNERRREVTGFNRVVVMGNLTRDPEVRKTKSGRLVADLGVAISESYKNSGGENVETTCFVDIVTWGRQAEVCGQYLSKGSQVLVEGRLQLDQWEGENGEKRKKLRVKADQVRFLSRGGRNGSNSASAHAGAVEDDNKPF